MPITTATLQRGDVMLKHGVYKSSHAAIAFGQALISHNLHGGGALTIHAAIFWGPGQVIESSTGGLALAPLSAGVDWDVYRYSGSPDIPDIATEIAGNYLELQSNGSGYGTYDKGAALGSLVRNSNHGRKALSKAAGLWSDPTHDKKFFCSNFVVRCYLAAGQTHDRPITPINADMNTSPKELKARLEADANWVLQGRLTT